MLGVQDLNNSSDANSGARITNVQRAINETFNAVGMTGIGDPSGNVYSSNNFIADGDNRKVAIGKLDAALKNVNDTLVAGLSFAFTDGQAFTDVAGETFDGVAIISVAYDFHVSRGTLAASGTFYLQYVDGAWRLELGGYVGDVHGLTFQVSNTGSVCQLELAVSTGPGDGTLYLRRKVFNV